MAETRDTSKLAGALPVWLAPGLTALAIVGALGTAAGLATQPDDTWRMLLANFLLWTGAAQGMVVWAAIFRTTQTTWSPAVGRLGRAAAGFLPVSLVMFAVLFVGREHWLPWLHHPVSDPGKAEWLNPTFFFGRDFAILAGLWVLSFFFDRQYREGEAAETPEQIETAQHRLNVLGIATVLAYCFGYTILAFDLVMSLAPEWYSSLLGAYFFVGNLYLAMALLILFTTALRGPLGWTPYAGRQQFRDMGNLALGFSLLTTGFMFAQYLTIWYGNLSEETGWIIRRGVLMPWKAVGFLLLGICYLGPFFTFALPWVKARTWALSTVSAVVVAGMWTERWMLVMPTFTPGRLAGLGPLQFAIPLACASLLALIVTSSLRRHPEVSSLDTALELAEGVSL